MRWVSKNTQAWSCEKINRDFNKKGRPNGRWSN